MSTQVILIDPLDNVVTAAVPLEAGERFTTRNARGEHTVTVAAPVRAGHKIAVEALAPGDAVIKYGAAIGDATKAVLPGEHVHSHNLAGYRGRDSL